ncbi:lipoprotein [Burkholderiaceae bacterium 16]|nr:lipoprotein [Burkholderiaceae bacterium 16]
MTRLLLILLAAGSTALAACGERPQTATATHKKSDAPAYEGAPGDPFVAKGWTQGDKTSWQNQIHERNQNQNEYNRTP